jgi:hypothetical protein
MRFYPCYVALVLAAAWSAYLCSVYVHRMHASYTALTMPAADIPTCERRYCAHATDTRVLFAVKSPALRTGASRRNLIRNTFARQIREYPQADYTFYLSSPDAENAPFIAKERRTHGDLTVITTIPETSPNTTRYHITMKTFEFFKQLKRQYSWVCHVDDDSYVQIYRLMERYLLSPRFHPFRTVIARVRTEPLFLDETDFPYPGGQMYCISGDIARTIATQFHAAIPELGADPNAWPSDDLVMGLFIRRALGTARWVDLPNPIAYDIGASWDINDYMHVPNPRQGINPHRLKENELFMTVARAHEKLFIRDRNASKIL